MLFKIEKYLMKTFIKLKSIMLISIFSVSVLTISAQTTDLDPIAKLKEGNSRFLKDQMQHQGQTSSKVKELIKGQHPFAVIVSCSDSRVSPEIVFDQGLGDLFSIRTAGNVMSDYEEGSVEYAAEHLHSKLIVVMGHYGCGAVKAFLDYVEKGNDDNVSEHHEKTADHISSIIEKLAGEEEESTVINEKGDHYAPAVKANVINGVKQLRNSQPILSKLYEDKEIQIVGAIYNIESGEVEFLDI